MDDASKFSAAGSGEAEPVAQRVALRLRVSGEVQQVGYRLIVKKLAQRYGLGGVVRNLPDGSVEVLAAGRTEALTGFQKALVIEDSLIAVRKIELMKSLTGAPRHEHFDIDWGDKQEQMLLSLAAGVTQQKETCRSVDGVGENVTMMRGEMKVGFDENRRATENVGENVSMMREDVVQELGKTSRAWNQVTRNLADRPKESFKGLAQGQDELHKTLETGL